MRTHFAIALALALPMPAVAAPAADGIKGAWVRINPAPGRPAAGYFSFTNGNKPDVLVGADATGTDTKVARVEMHQMTMDGGVMKMSAIGSLPIKAGETVEFKSGGYHLMLFGLENPGKAVPITLRFQSGARISALAEVRSAGSAQPNPHAGH
ncbi:hypothetical protein FHS79_000371 [Polymorphobacter multimanifer]|uniref:Copper chaperone PCu(A)C n=1 Tax=Polymorphobacter multimanifer TaxID=1070431 RepID=A0A841LB32_9SPHN|nr:hypothetical protein [Polymorphobacter multimanifer]